MSAPLMILLISASFIIVGIIRAQKGTYLLKNGKRAKAVVYKNNYSSDGDGGAYMPVVRFLTDKDEWITQELSIGYSPAIPEGTKLDVLYDPEEPTNVEINSSFQLRVLPLILVLLGVSGFVFGTLEYLNIIDVISETP